LKQNSATRLIFTEFKCGTFATVNHITCKALGVDVQFFIINLFTIDGILF